MVRDVQRGTALIEGRMGLIEVDQGDVVPGLGRIDAIRKQDGRWVVVTSKGTIMPPRSRRLTAGCIAGGIRGRRLTCFGSCPVALLPNPANVAMR